MTVAEEWMERGKQRERQGTLLRQIERKFGPEARDRCQKRVEKASADELEVWLDRILDAEDVEAIFADG